MITITNSTNYLRISDSEDGFDETVKKTAITVVSKKETTVKLYYSGGDFEIDPDDVTSPSVEGVDGLYTTILGYL